MNIFKDSDPTSRRSFISGAAKAFLGVGAMPVLSQLAHASGNSGNAFANNPILPGAGKAKSVIYIYLGGGMSHIDTLDTKPGSETQGPVESIKTSADGIQISEFLPGLANQMHHVSLINSMNSTQGAHAQGRYFMHTSYFMRGTIRHPDMGAWSAYHLGKRNKGLPANIKIGGDSSGLGSGFMESKYAAVPIRDPEIGLQNSQLAKGVDNDQFDRRLQRLKKMNKNFSTKYDTKQTRAYASMYDEAVKLMRSKDLEAFDLTKEKQQLRQRYGDNPFGQGCLLARRLVENGVRFIEVNNGGWDTHNDNFTRVAENCESLDQGLASLLADLNEKGMLEETLVVLATEFGRTPTIQSDRDNGRNHYPQAFSCLLAGGGIKGGFRYGKTDEEGREVIEDMVQVPDFNATIAHAMGIPLEKQVVSPSMRPFTVADKGKPILDVFV